jgi:hypothetical protein
VVRMVPLVVEDEVNPVAGGRVNLVAAEDKVAVGIVAVACVRPEVVVETA